MSNNEKEMLSPQGHNQQQLILEYAAKACEPEYQYDELEHCWYKETDDAYFGNPEWNPVTNSADTAEMCAKLEISTLYFKSCKKISCGFLTGDEATLAHIEPYGNDREAAWRYAATMVAAKIGGME